MYIGICKLEFSLVNLEIGICGYLVYGVGFFFGFGKLGVRYEK